MTVSVLVLDENGWSSDKKRLLRRLVATIHDPRRANVPVKRADDVSAVALPATSPKGAQHTQLRGQRAQADERHPDWSQSAGDDPRVISRIVMVTYVELIEMLALVGALGLVSAVVSSNRPAPYRDARERRTRTRIKQDMQVGKARAQRLDWVRITAQASGSPTVHASGPSSQVQRSKEELYVSDE